MNEENSTNLFGCWRFLYHLRIQFFPTMAGCGWLLCLFNYRRHASETPSSWSEGWYCTVRSFPLRQIDGCKNGTLQVRWKVAPYHVSVSFLGTLTLRAIRAKVLSLLSLIGTQPYLPSRVTNAGVHRLGVPGHHLGTEATKQSRSLTVSGHRPDAWS